jgi:hypothetical protein
VEKPNTLAYCITATITAVKCFIVQVSNVTTVRINHFEPTQLSFLLQDEKNVSLVFIYQKNKHFFLQRKSWGLVTLAEMAKFGEKFWPTV